MPWFRFQQAFLVDYDSQLKGTYVMCSVIWSSCNFKTFVHPGLFPEDQIPWLLDMLQNDIFGGADAISKDHFYQVRD